MTDPAPGFLHRFRRPILLGCVLLWLAALVVTHYPIGGLPELPASDKTLHVTGYLGLGLALLVTLTAYRIRRRWRLTLLLLAVPIYAALDELTQPLFNRYAELLDWFADVAGLLLATLTWELILWLRKRTGQTPTGGA